MNRPFTVCTRMQGLSVLAPFLPYVHTPRGALGSILGDGSNFSFLQLSVASQSKTRAVRRTKYGSNRLD